MKAYGKFTALLLSILMTVSPISAYAVRVEDAPCAVGAQMGAGVLPVGSNIPESVELLPVGADLPARYSSKDAGYTTPVRSQEAYTCWAFGALSNFETLLLKNNIDTDVFSVQHMNFWGSKKPDGLGWQREANMSGYPYIPLGYLMSRQGPFSMDAFPESSTYNDFEALSSSPQYVATATEYYNEATDHDSIKLLIYKYGSVVASFNSDPNYLSKGSNFYCGDSDIALSALQGHCVSLVGWDDSYAKENFSDSLSGTPENDGAWIMKNSWGEDSGDKGYFYISYEDVWLFSNKFGPGYTITDYDLITENTAIYQNEIYGSTYEFNYLGNYRNVLYMNVFDFAEEDRTLDKVIFETTSLGAEYTVYYIHATDTGISSDTRFWKTLYEGTVSYSGYICADFENFKVPAGRGAIGVRINTQGTDSLNSIGASEWLGNPGGDKIFLPDADYGMSYYSVSSKFTDVMDYYKNNLGDTIGGTFVIKAITEDPATVPTVPTSVIPETTAVEEPPYTTTPIITDPLETNVPVPTTEKQTQVLDVYFTNNQDWDKTNVYYWGSAQETIYWPGVPMTYVRTNSYGQDIFMAQIPADIDGFVFGDGEKTQTVNITENFADGMGYYLTDKAEDGRWNVEGYKYSDIDPTVPSTVPHATTVSTTATPDTSEATTAVFSTADTTVETTNETTVLTTSPDAVTYKLGDADLSGKINIKDATLIQKHAAKLETIDGYGALAADVTGDGKINVIDATNIQKFLANMPIAFEIGKEFSVSA